MNWYKGGSLLGNQEMHPLDLLKIMFNYPSGQFNPEGSGYDYKTALASGMRPNPSSQHWGSLDPSTGMVLKGIGHDTFMSHTVPTEQELHNLIIKNILSGRYYSQPANRKK
jgi:hypothetical protein